ncbi:MAG: hypothetical protein AAF408_02000 [Pseudomonadota bacterium]
MTEVRSILFAVGVAAMATSAFAAQAAGRQMTDAEFWGAVDARVASYCPSEHQSFAKLVRSGDSGQGDTINRFVAESDARRLTEVDPVALTDDWLQIRAWVVLAADSIVPWTRIENWSQDDTVSLAQVKVEAQKLEAYEALLQCLHPSRELLERTGAKADSVKEIECKHIYTMYARMSSSVLDADGKSELADALLKIKEDTFGRCLEGAS